MFEKLYKSAMNKVVPTEDALNKTLSAMKEEADPSRKRKQIVRRSIICVAAVALVFSSVFTAFKISDAVKYSGGKDSFEGYGKMIGLRAAGSEKEIENAISEYSKRFLNYEINGINDLFGWFYTTDEAQEVIGLEGEGLTDQSAAVYSPAADDVPDHSDTNNQVSGVQEADIVKNDGRYIYFCSAANRKLYITEVKDGNMTELSETVLDIETPLSPKEMLLIGDKLAIICDYNYDIDYNYNKYYSEYDSSTICVFFDITDRTAPKLVNKSSQSGYYISSRAIGDYIYIVSNYTGYARKKILPEVNRETIDAGSTYLPDKLSNTAFTVVTSFNTGSDRCDNTDSISVLSVSNILYSGKDNLYLTTPRYIDNKSDRLHENQRVIESKTDIYRIELKNGKMEPTAFGNVPGTLNNQFSIDESGNTLRIATNIRYATVVKRHSNIPFINEYTLRTSSDDTCNKVFCLDDELNIIGESEPLGITEQIKSVRYIGDIAYVVTFRQTDPLYAVDLSDAKNPKTLSALKIKGFSTYMHPYGDGLLLGIGYDANAYNGQTKGLKLTMFDISDPAKAYSISSCILNWDSGYSNSTALYNHKAALIDAKKNIIAIPITENKEALITQTVTDEYGNSVIDEYSGFITSTYFVFFEFDGKTLTEQKRITVCEGEKELNDLRGLYIGNYGYLTYNEGIIAIDLDTFETVETLVYGE